MRRLIPVIAVAAMTVEMGCSMGMVFELQNRVEQADQLALDGYRRGEKHDYVGATVQYRKALAGLPRAPMTHQRRTAYAKQFHKANFRAAQDDFEKGNYVLALTRCKDSWAGWLGILAGDPVVDSPLKKQKRYTAWDGFVGANWKLMIAIAAACIMFGLWRGVSLARRTVVPDWRWFFSAPFVIPAAVLVLTVAGVFSGFFRYRDYCDIRAVIYGITVFSSILVMTGSMPFLLGKYWGFCRFR